MRRLRSKYEMPDEVPWEVQCHDKRVSDRSRSPAQPLNDARPDEGMNPPDRIRPSSIHGAASATGPRPAKVLLVTRLLRISESNPSNSAQELDGGMNGLKRIRPSWRREPAGGYQNTVHGAMSATGPRPAKAPHGLVRPTKATNRCGSPSSTSTSSWEQANASIRVSTYLSERNPDRSA